MIEIHSQAKTITTAHFLDTLEERMPFPVPAIQVDSGSEFESTFEEACQSQNIKLFVLPPRSPKLNGGVSKLTRRILRSFMK